MSDRTLGIAVSGSDLKERARQLKLDIPALFIALGRRETPWYAKALAGAVVVYALSPVDLIPDFIPVIGFLDDVILLPGLVALTLRAIPDAVMDDCRLQAEGFMESAQGRQRWYYALPFVAVWALLLWWIGSIVVGMTR